MAVSAEFLEYVLDQLAGFASVRSRRMFGGVGLYADDVFFGLIDNDALYFKVDDSNRPDYVARGCQPFRPFPDDPTYSMSYFQVPVDVLEEPDALKDWARKAATAQGARSRKRKASAAAEKSGQARSARGRSRTVRK